MKKTIIVVWVVILLLPVTSFNTAKIASTQEISNVTSSFSWRDINGTDYTTPIRDQSPAPTCEAFAFCAALETKMQYQLKEIYNPDLSENHLFFYAGGSIQRGGVSVTTQQTISSTMAFLMKDVTLTLIETLITHLKASQDGKTGL